MINYDIRHADSRIAFSMTELYYPIVVEGIKDWLQVTTARGTSFPIASVASKVSSATILLS